MRSLQRVLNRAVWNADVGRRVQRAYVEAALGTPERLLAVDEAGLLKNAAESAGVEWQYIGMSGEPQNFLKRIIRWKAAGKARADPDACRTVMES